MSWCASFFVQWCIQTAFHQYFHQYTIALQKDYLFTHLYLVELVNFQGFSLRSAGRSSWERPALARIEGTWSATAKAMYIILKE
jgi:hypothetical protein